MRAAPLVVKLCLHNAITNRYESKRKQFRFTFMYFCQSVLETQFPYYHVLSIHLLIQFKFSYFI